MYIWMFVIAKEKALESITVIMLTWLLKMCVYFGDNSNAFKVMSNQSSVSVNGMSIHHVVNLKKKMWVDRKWHLHFR